MHCLITELGKQLHPRFSSSTISVALKILRMYLPSFLILRPGGISSSLFFIGPRMMIRVSLHPQEIDLWQSNRVSSLNPAMCILALSNNFGSYGVLEELENMSHRILVILLSKFENLFICVDWLKLLPRLKMGL